MKKFLIDSPAIGRKSPSGVSARVLAILAITAGIPAVQANSLTYYTSFLTDANQPASATAVFDYTGGTTFTVTLTDTTVNPISDAPNLAEISFTMNGLSGGSATAASGSTVSGITNNVTPTTGTYSGSGSPWTLSSGTSGWWTQLYSGSAETYDLYAPAGTTTPPCLMNTAPYSIVGSPSGNGTYTGGSGPIGSANFLNSGCDGTMFYESATFTISIPTLTGADFASLSNVGFGFGPDSANNPDMDDVHKGVLAPEPTSITLIGLGLCGIALLRRRSKNHGPDQTR
jgi:hypothetical protein